MTAHNDITGAKIATKHATKSYRDNYDAIFGKNKKFNGVIIDKEEPKEEEKENVRSEDD
jgi:hypothetical protein